MTVNVYLLVALAGVSAYAVAQWFVKKDTEKENRRRGAADLAGVLKGLGLTKIPSFLVDYSVGDYSGMVYKIKQLAELFLSGEEAVLAEFKDVFEKVLAAKLKDETGRAFIAAKLADAVQENDASVVRDAPVAAVK